MNSKWALIEVIEQDPHILQIGYKNECVARGIETLTWLEYSEEAKYNFRKNKAFYTEEYSISIVPMPEE